MENDQKASSYDAVIADLRQRIAKLENTIAVLEQLKAGGLPGLDGGLASGAQTPSENEGPLVGPGAFFGMTVHDAAKKLLAAHRREMPTTEIVPELERGGIRLTSADKVNTVGSILLRRFQNAGDIVRVSRGRWGLQEWYPGRKFPGGKNSKAEEQKGDDMSEITDVPANEAGTSPPPPPPVAGYADWVERQIGPRIPDEGDV